MRCQIPVVPSDYPFLDHDSFWACHEVKKLFSAEEIQDQLEANPARIEGEITLTTRDLILEIIKDSTMISPREKRWITEALTQLESTSPT